LRRCITAAADHYGERSQKEHPSYRDKLKYAHDLHTPISLIRQDRILCSRAPPTSPGCAPLSTVTYPRRSGRGRNRCGILGFALRAHLPRSQRWAASIRSALFPRSSSCPPVTRSLLAARVPLSLPAQRPTGWTSGHIVRIPKSRHTSSRPFLLQASGLV